MSNTVTVQSTTPKYTLKNAKGEKVGYDVRAANETEARYRAGVPQGADVPTGSTTSVTETEYVSKDSYGHRQ